jgi:hypothetical protein
MRGQHTAFLEEFTFLFRELWKRGERRAAGGSRTAGGSRDDNNTLQ